MFADVFFRLYHRELARTLSPENVRSIRILVPVDATIADIIHAAHEAGASVGSSRSGIFEVQTDTGIWSRADGGKLEVDTERKLSKIVFRSWEALEEAA